MVYDAVGTTILESMAGGEPPAVSPRLLMDRSLTLTGGDLWNVLVSAEIRRQRAEELFTWIADGSVSVRIAKTFPMAETHRFLESRAAIGKVLLVP